MNKLRRAILGLLALALLPGHWLGLAAYSQESSRTFSETGKTVRGKFLAYWDAHGGLAQQGFPISEEMKEKSDTDGKTYTVQYFERAVFEMHPENQPPYDVLLSLLGVFRYKEKYPGGAPGQQPNISAESILIRQTGKRLGGSFLLYWQQHGGLAQQGYPISNEFMEVSDLDGKQYRMQYFERAVFEYHPENAGTQYEVLLSQLGKYRLTSKYPGGTGQWSRAENLDNDAGRWIVPWCETDDRGTTKGINCADPNAAKHDLPTLVSSPSLDGKALRLGLAGSANSPGQPDHYRNVMYRYDIADRSAAQASAFALDLQFMYTPPTSFNLDNWNGKPARIQAIEFGVTRWLGDRNWDWEVAWSNVRPDKNLPSTWSIAGVNEWIDTGVAAFPAANQWHHIVLNGRLQNGQTYYDSFSIDGVSHTLGKSFPPRPVGGELVTAHVQLDGNPFTFQGNDYQVLVDQMKVTWR